MPFDIVRARPLLQNADLTRLFVEELGWEPCRSSITISMNGSDYVLNAVAEKKGFVAWIYTCPDNILPDHNTRLKLDRKLSETSFEHLIVFITNDNSRQSWMWVRREKGRPLRARTYEYQQGHAGDSLLQKIQHLYISLEEEESGISITQVSGRARAAFDVERITKRFYERFQREHAAFLDFIKGIPVEDDKAWYASVMLNRLMFLYFIQKKGFLDGDPNYLRNRLKAMQERHGRDTFYSFYRYFLLRLFHEGLGKVKHPHELESLIGKVPYINGGIFDVHTIEDNYGRDIQISDNAFESIFDYFDEYDWVLDPERSQRNSTGREEINPDVLGYIFEKYINQKQMGAYYTKEDITEYISKNTIIPFLFDAARQKCRIAFEGEHSVWRLLQTTPDRYIYPAVKHGIVQNDIITHAVVGAGFKPAPTRHLPPEIVAGVTDVSKRTEWNKPAPAEYALPTEIWREVVSRRKRYEEVRKKLESGEVKDINDLITLNLDIRQFAQDVISNCEGPDLLRAFWHVIKDISVLDPTCGSGAFLFAALNILEPLYEACLDRMEEMLEDGAAKHTIVGAIHESPLRHTPHGYPLLPHRKLEDFSHTLEQVANHPNKQYFIYKSIILNNLYGVDIMEEAVEICKLRLFLKLAAQVDPDTSKSNFGIEPLPDIDFNIRAGNTLVGFTALEQIKKAMTTEKKGQATQKKLLYQDDLDTMKRIEEKAQDIDSLAALFRQQQTELGGEITAANKQELKKRLKTLEDELNRYLASEYGIFKDKQTDEKKFLEWLASHKPFHWFIEFHAIMKNGGFDVIIGNPPYVEYNKVKKEYTIHGYQTEDCGNLYAFIVERNSALLHNNGRTGMIVPHSSICTDRMEPLQYLFTGESHKIWISTYCIRPAKLFVGVDQRLAIYVLQKKAQISTIFSSCYHRWNEEFRPHLFPLIEYVDVSVMKFQNSLPKAQSILEQHIWNKQKLFNTVSAFLSDHGKYSVYFHNAPRYWIRAMDFAPYFWNERDGEQISNQVKLLSLSKKLESSVIVAALNSSLFYWWFLILSDCRHLNLREIENFPIELDKMSDTVKHELSNLSTMLMDDLKQHKQRKECQYKATGKVIYDEFYPKYSKSIIDEIDRVLARHYGFTDEELDFIINYDIKYRMGRDALENDESS
ncbi:MAG: Eco57I restriction-modification methylase domain-containing protein [Candidatus Brocadia sp.]|nr:Eco57I restriction-modification methylase domain-containing protein [Candidatus Brocadia sp.]